MYDAQARSRRRRRQGRRRQRYIRLDRGCQADIQWWLRAWEATNGVHLMPDERWVTSETLGWWTDSSLVGYGGAFLREDGVLEYFHGQWPEGHGLHINELELGCAALSAKLWGPRLAGLSIYMHIDNEAAKSVMNSGTGRCAPMMVAQRELALDQLKHGFRLRGEYIDTKANVLGDSLSRFHERGQAERFFAHARNAHGVTEFKQVVPPHDVGHFVKRMQRAQRNAALAAARFAES